MLSGAGGFSLEARFADACKEMASARVLARDTDLGRRWYTMSAWTSAAPFWPNATSVAGPRFAAFRGSWAHTM